MENNNTHFNDNNNGLPTNDETLKSLKSLSILSKAGTYGWFFASMITASNFIKYAINYSIDNGDCVLSSAFFGGLVGVSFTALYIFNKTSNGLNRRYYKLANSLLGEVKSIVHNNSDKTHASDKIKELILDNPGLDKEVMLTASEMSLVKFKKTKDISTAVNVLTSVYRARQ